MDTVLSVAEGLADAEDYFLDLNTDPAVEDFDFKFEGAFEDDVQKPAAEDVPEDAPVANGEFEIGYEDDEGQDDHMEDKNAGEESGETGHEIGSDEEAGTGYEDEIGYEDDEPPATDVDAGQEAEETASTAETHQAHDNGLNDGTPRLEATSTKQVEGQSGVEEPNEEHLLQSGFDDPKHISGLGDNAGPEVETTGNSPQPSHPSQGRPPASVPDGTDDSVDISNTPSAVPEITVHYNQGQYALIGAPTDDPDSYFLSDEKDLDGSLSEFLASIRAVISDELSSEDELTIRIDALDLEFGERSNQKFLNRNFHEIIACYSALAAGPSKSVSYDPHSLDLELLIRRDCEARFLDLLDEAGIVGELSHLPDHFDESEDIGDTAPEAATDGAPVGDGPGNSDPEDYAAGDDDAAMGNQDDDTGVGSEEQVVIESPHEKGDHTMGGSLELDGGPSEPSGEATYEEQYQIHFEGYDDAEALEEEPHGGGIDILGDASGETGDGFTAERILAESELTFEITDQPPLGHDNSHWFGEAIEQLGGADGKATQAESSSHDDDIALALDADAMQSATSEASDTIHSFRDTNATLDGGEEMNAAQPLDHATENGTINSSVDLSGGKSKNTSRTSTVNGDEIDFEEAAVDELLAVDEEADQAGELFEPGKDEIDWENDGDESEQNPTLTPSSISGKRNRTNDEESPPDEADCKRRRT